MVELVALKAFKHPERKGVVVRTGGTVTLTDDNARLYRALKLVAAKPAKAPTRRKKTTA